MKVLWIDAPFDANDPSSCALCGCFGCYNFCPGKVCAGYVCVGKM